MKYFAIPLLAGTVLCCAHASAQNLEVKEHVTKEFTLTQSAATTTLAIYNINGSIKVEGYSGDKVLIEIDQTISAKTSEDLEKGKQEFKMDFEQKADSIVAYIAAPHDTRPNRNKRNWDGPKIRYQYELDFTVKVPYALNLLASTVNHGNVDVQGVTGNLKALNVNGNVRIVDAKGPAIARTVNGNVEANFLNLPPGESDFKTLNGDIRITYPNALAIDCQFKTFNGNFYTDFPDVESLPARVIKNAEGDANKTVYKLNTQTFIRIGKGGPTYKFETFNGNIYLKKQS